MIRPDRDALARYGMAVAQIMGLVSDAIGGREAGQVIRGNERYDINVRLAGCGQTHSLCKAADQ